MAFHYRNAMVHRLGKTVLSVLFGATVAVLNPAFACSSEEDIAEWEYEEADMRAAVEGTYLLTVGDAGEAVTITLRQSSASTTGTTASSLRLQCGNVQRSFVKDAGACFTVYFSEMALTATIQSAAQTVPSGEYQGYFGVEGTQLESGELTFSVLGDRDLLADYYDGEVRRWNFRGADGEWVELLPAQVTAPASVDAGG